MKERKSALYSEYIIDGIAKPLTPAQILNGCLAPGTEPKGVPEPDCEPLADETKDPDPSCRTMQEKSVNEFLDGILPLLDGQRQVSLSFPEEFTKSRIALALLKAIWLKGHFKLSNLTLSARWKWDPRPIGNLAAFYSSAEAVADYLESLGIFLSRYSYASGDTCQVQFKVAAAERAEDEDFDPEWDIELQEDSPFSADRPVLRRTRAVGSSLVADADSWIIFIPFDSCEFRLGGSLLQEAFGSSGDSFPSVGDGDYFMDCYEIVREFVEDKVLLAGATVGDGGLLAALKGMCSDRTGAAIDIGGIMGAYGENDATRILFSEIPGAIIQIKDIEYDYVDAELLLQDIAYYPVGHPVPGSGRITVKTDGGNALTGILQSLLGNQTAEGED